MRRTLPALIALVLLAGFPGSAAGFSHIVKHGETLASIAERMYGAVQLERILVAANGLTGASATPIAPGMLLEIPAPSHYRVLVGDTFASIATELLGADYRASALAEANDSKPWLPPDPGTQLLVPYNLRIVASDEDTLTGVAYRFLGDRKKAWSLDQYNHLEGRAFKRGDMLLIPIVDLPLTKEGKQAALIAAGRQESEALGAGRDAQRKAESELPMLVAEVKAGSYVEAVVRGVQLLAGGELSRSQLAAIHRRLLEAYTALGAKGRAQESCQMWLKNDPTAVLDPVMLSPKILAACPARVPATQDAPAKPVSSGAAEPH